MDRGRVAALDGVRAVAVGLVLLSHWMYQPWAPRPLVPWLTLGAWGVQVFFVLSGYLITSLLMAEWRASGHVSLRAFYIRRVFRIMPAFYVFLLVMACLGAAGLIDAPIASLLASGVYAGDYVNLAPTIVGHTWSLAVEEQFYLLWPAILILAGPRRARRVAVAALLACPLARLISLGWTPGSLVAAMQYRFDTQADALAIGCLAALSHNELAAWITKSPTTRLLVRLTPLLLLAVMEAHTVGGVGALVFSAAPGPVLFDLGVAVILVFCVTQPTSAIARSFSWSPVAGIGLISYSLYLWQEAVWHAGPIISLALALTLALTSYYVVERPMRRVGRALAQRFADNATDSSEPRHAATAPA